MDADDVVEIIHFSAKLILHKTYHPGKLSSRPSNMLLTLFTETLETAFQKYCNRRGTKHVDTASLIDAGLWIVAFFFVCFLPLAF